jgi:hypothetical protein
VANKLKNEKGEVNDEEFRRRYKAFLEKRKEYQSSEEMEV